MHYFVYIYIYINKCNNIYQKSYLFKISIGFIYENFKNFDNFKLDLHKIIICAKFVHYNSNYFCYNALFYLFFSLYIHNIYSLILYFYCI